MVTPKLYNISTGTQKVFSSDVPIKGIDYVALYTSTTGVAQSYVRVQQSEYQVVDDTVVFTEPPQGAFLRLVVASERSELLNTPSMVTTVGANMDVLRTIIDNLDYLITINEGVKTSFKVNSEETLVLDDVTNPKHFNLDLVDTPTGFEYEATTQSIRNRSGRSVDMVGMLGVQAIRTGTQDATLYIYSETSSDGVTWIKNSNSLREWVLKKDAVDFLTIPSVTITAWANGDRIRFKFYKAGTGGVTLLTPEQVVQGDTIKGQSMIWFLDEQ